MVDHPTYAPCEVTLYFGGDERLFKLPLKQIAALQEKTHTGIGALYKRVLLGDYFASDNVEIIRHSLIGGGLTVGAADRLVETFLADMPQIEIWRIAKHAISACIIGYQPEDSKKNAETTPTKMPTDGSTTQEPSATAPS